MDSRKMIVIQVAISLIVVCSYYVAGVTMDGNVIQKLQGLNEMWGLVWIA